VVVKVGGKRIEVSLPSGLDTVGAARPAANCTKRCTVSGKSGTVAGLAAIFGTTVASGTAICEIKD
jgi:hypothetical protein